MSPKYISDVVDVKDLKTNEFNIISSGCGTGKTYFITHEILHKMSDIEAKDIIFVTSRSMIVDQQSRNEGVNKFDYFDKSSIHYWNGDLEDLHNNDIEIMTYDKLINILIHDNATGKRTLDKIKMVILDECHTLFSDTFIKNIDVLKVWIHSCIYEEDNNKVFLGLTATPNILLYYQAEWGVKMNRLNKETLMRYRASQLHCTNMETLPYIIATNKLLGKTIIMCPSIKECISLQDQLPNAALLVSKFNKFYTGDMDRIREFIINNETLPEYFEYPIERDQYGNGTKFEKRNLEILITTSTLREGVNIREESGVKNVVCCFQDELHISQFMGRCRFDIDNLVVVDTYIRYNNLDKDSYLAESREEFKKFMENKSNIAWFDSIGHLVKHDVYGTRKFILGTDEKRFIDYINGRWLLPIGSDDFKYRIWTQKDKDEIINMAVSCKLFDLRREKITFNRVMNSLVNSFGYEVVSGVHQISRKRYTYKLITDFYEEKIVYISPYKTINE